MISYLYILVFMEIHYMLDLGIASHINTQSSMNAHCPTRLGPGLVFKKKVTTLQMVKTFFTRLAVAGSDFFTPIFKRIIYSLQCWKPPITKLKWMPKNQFDVFYADKMQPLKISKDTLEKNRSIEAHKCEFTLNKAEEEILVVEQLRRMILVLNPKLSNQQFIEMSKSKNLYNHFLALEKTRYEFRFYEQLCNKIKPHCSAEETARNEQFFDEKKQAYVASRSKLHRLEFFISSQESSGPIVDYQPLHSLEEATDEKGSTENPQGQSDPVQSSAAPVLNNDNVDKFNSDHETEEDSLTSWRSEYINRAPASNAVYNEAKTDSLEEATAEKGSTENPQGQNDPVQSSTAPVLINDNVDEFNSDDETEEDPLTSWRSEYINRAPASNTVYNEAKTDSSFIKNIKKLAETTNFGNPRPKMIHLGECPDLPVRGVTEDTEFTEALIPDSLLPDNMPAIITHCPFSNNPRSATWYRYIHSFTSQLFKYMCLDQLDGFIKEHESSDYLSDEYIACLYIQGFKSVNAVIINAIAQHIDNDSLNKILETAIELCKHLTEKGNKLAGLYAEKFMDVALMIYGSNFSKKTELLCGLIDLVDFWATESYFSERRYTYPTAMLGTIEKGLMKHFDDESVNSTSAKFDGDFLGEIFLAEIQRCKTEVKYLSDPNIGSEKNTELFMGIAFAIGYSELSDKRKKLNKVLEFMDSCIQFGSYYSGAVYFSDSSRALALFLELLNNSHQDTPSGNYTFNLGSDEHWNAVIPRLQNVIHYQDNHYNIRVFKKCKRCLDRYQSRLNNIEPSKKGSESVSNR